MKVRIDYIEEGCIVTQPVMGMTRHPIIEKNTVLTSMHLSVLRAFRIPSVNVAHTKADGSLFIPPEVDQQPEVAAAVEDIVETEQPAPVLPSFRTRYYEAVQSYHTLFSNWQAGIKVDFVELRALIIPVMGAMLDEPDELQTIHLHADPATYDAHHAVATAVLSGMIAKQLQMDASFITQVTLAAFVANVGMAKVPQSILNKTTALTHEEGIEIKKHPIHSYQAIMETPFLKKEMKLAVYQHHERLDGSGYPKGEKGEAITVYSQILAAADAYYTKVVPRHSEPSRCSFQALDYLLEDQFGKFDLLVVRALQELIGNLSIGTEVELSDGRKAEVLFTQSEHRTRPMIRIKENEEIIDLATNRSFFIKEVLAVQ